MSSIDWLERRLPDSMKPAYRIQGPAPLAGNVSRIARRTYSATGMPNALASFLASAYSRSSRLICVRIMLSLSFQMITPLRFASCAPSSADRKMLLDRKNGRARVFLGLSYAIWALSSIVSDSASLVSSPMKKIILILESVKDTRGQDLIEYALMAGFVAVTAGAIMPGVASSISTIFSQVASVMSIASTQGN